MRFSTLALALAAVLWFSSLSQAQQILDYKTAYKNAQKGDKPMLVLLTSKFCPPCQQMKQFTMPELLAKNDLKDCYLANVDVHADAVVAKQILDALPPGKRGYPQLLIFEKRQGKWYRRNHGGFMTAAHVREFVAKSPLIQMAKQNSLLATKQKANTAKTTTPTLTTK